MDENATPGEGFPPVPESDREPAGQVGEEATNAESERQQSEADVKANAETEQTENVGGIAGSEVGEGTHASEGSEGEGDGDGDDGAED